ncbi:MAG: GNAT family N-acetyltransferase [Clostridia bacterium]|nr:GNAT family N-acetyltransferase [Clostridia bacterium]
MLRLCENIAELDFLPPDPYAARISALAQTYGFSQSFVLFWVQYADDAPVAAVCRLDGCMSICCLENADYEELSEFVKAVGFSALSCREETLRRLGFEASKASYIVKYNAVSEKEENGVLWDYDKKAVYELLCDCGFDMGGYGSFVADYCSKLNKGTAKLAAVAHERLDACASALFIGERSVLLGAVATRESARGKGYASRAVRALADSFKDKTVYLFCRNDSLLGFYEKIGFESDGRWTEYQLRS